MLSSLHVKNLALIQEAEVEFGPGLNILTGETGAGKSILIGSINLALGKKLSREMIREGETSALVELVFDTENPKVEEALKAMEIESMNGQVLIVRKITGDAASAKLTARPARQRRCVRLRRSCWIFTVSMNTSPYCIRTVSWIFWMLMEKKSWNRFCQGERSFPEMERAAEQSEGI